MISMDPNVGEWLHLIIRWFHIIAGIMWIGSSIFFHWLDSHLTVPAEKKPGVEGELWMVHSGGFYQVEKKLVAPSELPATLHWFKWEAGFTWVSGFFLLVLLYYMGGGILLVDPQVSSISVPAATAVGIGVLIVSWAIYDTLWSSALGKVGPAAITISTALVLGVAFGLTRVLSGRAAYMHVGAMLGTWMVANVWMRIIPAQRALVAAVREGRAPDAELARKAKQRSKHNNYMTYPVIFIMISNHFPNTFGVGSSWIILAGLFFFGAGVRHYQNVRGGSPRLLFAAIGLVIALAAIVSLMRPTGQPKPRPIADGSKTAGPKVAAPIVVDPATVGSMHIVVRFKGTVPPPVELPIPGNCPRKEPAYEDKVLASEGRLQNVFVWISQGLEGWSEPAPTEEIRVDQQGCMYSPRVLGVRVGQPIAFFNSDPLMHNVHAVVEENTDFNLPMPERSPPLRRTFTEVEVMVRMKCDVHPWMNSFIGVVPHPFFVVTGPKGEHTFEKVPPGDYVVEAWHEVHGKLTRKVTLAPKGTAEADFTF
jgi:uncharacterized membrane protein/plastocyanin